MWFMTMRGKQILARAIGIQKENWVSGTFFGDNEATIILKNGRIQSNVWRFSLKIEPLLSLKNARLPQIFFSDTKSTC